MTEDELKSIVRSTPCSVYAAVYPHGYIGLGYMLGYLRDHFAMDELVRVEVTLNGTQFGLIVAPASLDDHLNGIALDDCDGCALNTLFNYLIHG